MVKRYYVGVVLSALGLSLLFLPLWENWKFFAVLVCIYVLTLCTSRVGFIEGAKHERDLMEDRIDLAIAHRSKKR